MPRPTAPCDQPLQAQVINGRLIVSIGGNVLAFSANRWLEEEAFEKSEGQSSTPEFLIHDEVRWTEEVARELMREDEMGVTLLTRMLDKAFAQVLRWGSCATADVHRGGPSE